MTRMDKDIDLDSVDGIYTLKDVIFRHVELMKKVKNPDTFCCMACILDAFLIPYVEHVKSKGGGEIEYG